MASKFVNLRLGEKLLREIDVIVKAETFESRTEFIREVLRKEIEARQKHRLAESLQKRFGGEKKPRAKEAREPLPEDFEEMREEIWKQLHESARQRAFPA